MTLDDLLWNFSIQILFDFFRWKFSGAIKVYRRPGLMFQRPCWSFWSKGCSKTFAYFQLPYLNNYKHFMWANKLEIFLWKFMWNIWTAFANVILFCWGVRCFRNITCKFRFFYNLQCYWFFCSKSNPWISVKNFDSLSHLVLPIPNGPLSSQLMDQTKENQNCSPNMFVLKTFGQNKGIIKLSLDRIINLAFDKNFKT